MTERRVTLDVAEQGPADAPVVLVCSGLGAQRLWWPQRFLDSLARDHRLLLPDNRDCGTSPWMDDLPADLGQLEAYLGGDRSTPPPYTLHDMADDLVGVLDERGLDRVHVLGASMGGMLAQHLAMSWPDRVRTLTAIMTTTGRAEVSQPTPAAAAVLVTPVPSHDRDAYVEAALASTRVISSPGLLDEDQVRARLGAAFDVGVNPPGTLRQLLALLADGNRTERLADVTAPSLVVHGLADPLIPPSGGQHLAEVLGAPFVGVEGMGHDLPSALHELVVRPVLAHLAAG